MKTLIWAHRGSSAYAPENTLEAFELAIKQGADGIELDVHFTADKKIVVSHDDRIDRASNGTGLIPQKTLEELKKLDFSKLHPEYSPVRIPTLKEVYDLIKPTGMTVNVEIKSGWIPYEGLEKMLIEEEREMGMVGRIWYSSFNHFTLKEIKTIDPNAKTGILYSEAMVDPHFYAQHIKVDALHAYYPTLFGPGVAEGCKQSGVKMHPWTVDDPNAMKKLIDIGADAIITNKPDALAQVLKTEA
jgi:glycerophosphoryl diester phosphodiesterase